MSDEPRDHNRGIYIPIGVWKLFEERVLNAEQIILLGKINTLQDPERGCWASNAWLAEWWGKSIRWVSKSISLFQKLGLVEYTFSKKGERQIRVTFQPDTPRSPGAPLEQKFQGPPRTKVLPTTKERKKTISSESEFAGDGIFGLKGEFSQFIKRVAAKLEDYVRAIHKIDPKIQRASWCKEFSLLLDSIGGDKARLKAAMKGYISTPLEERKPQAWCARSFRKKFLQIESYLKERSRKQPPSDYRAPDYIVE
jgi:hypothetical protein